MGAETPELGAPTVSLSQSPVFPKKMKPFFTEVLNNNGH